MAYIAKNLVMAPLGDATKMPDGTPCPAGTIYNSFYDSCVNPCPRGQGYNDQGICTSSTTVGSGSVINQVASSVPGGMATLVVGAVALGAWLAFGGKKRRR